MSTHANKSTVLITQGTLTLYVVSYLECSRIHYLVFGEYSRAEPVRVAKWRAKIMHVVQSRCSHTTKLRKAFLVRQQRLEIETIHTKKPSLTHWPITTLPPPES